LYNRKRWTGWELNPRPQPAYFLRQLYALSKWQPKRT
jgi:hypothetical protein